VEWVQDLSAEQVSWLKGDQGKTTYHNYLIDAYDINNTKITVIEVVFRFPPNHWYSTFQAASLSICPLAQMLRKSFTYKERTKIL
jgi:hypothetical protein